LAPNYLEAVSLIKNSYTRVRPRKLTDFTLVGEYDTTKDKPQIIGAPEFYRGFEDEDI